MTTYFTKMAQRNKEKMYHPDSLFVKNVLQSQFYNRIYYMNHVLRIYSYF